MHSRSPGAAGAGGGDRSDPRGAHRRLRARTAHQAKRPEYLARILEGRPQPAWIRDPAQRLGHGCPLRVYAARPLAFPACGNGARDALPLRVAAGDLRLGSDCRAARCDRRSDGRDSRWSGLGSDGRELPSHVAPSPCRLVDGPVASSGRCSLYPDDAFVGLEARTGARRRVEGENVFRTWRELKPHAALRRAIVGTRVAWRFRDC